MPSQGHSVSHVSKSYNKIAFFINVSVSLDFYAIVFHVLAFKESFLILLLMIEIQSYPATPENSTLRPFGIVFSCM